MREKKKKKSSIKIHIISRDREKRNSLNNESRMIQEKKADFEMKKMRIRQRPQQKFNNS